MEKKTLFRSEGEKYVPHSQYVSQFCSLPRNMDSNVKQKDGNSNFCFDDSHKGCSNYVRAKHIDSSTECRISTFVTCSFSEVPLAFSFCKWAAFLCRTGDKSQR